MPAIIATTFGAFPERIDLTFVFGAYALGAIAAQLVAGRPGRLPAHVYEHRWGGWLMAGAAGYWLLGMLGLIG